MYHRGAQLVSGRLQGSAGTCSAATQRQHSASAPSCQGIQTSFTDTRICSDAIEHSSCSQRLTRRQSTSAGCCASLGSKAVAEWSDLATASSDDYVAEEDPVFQEDINRLCNVGLKAMLRDERREVSEWQDELNQYGSHFGEEGNRDAAIFIYTLYQMSEHKLPTESLQLKGIYLRAFEKLFNMLEDSGWALERGDNQDGSDGSDDELPELPGL